VATGLSAVTPMSLARRLMPRGSQAAPRDYDHDHADRPRRRAGAAS